MPVGLIAAAILIVNNVRDMETDRRAGKRTLAVRLGRARTRVLYAVVLTRRLRRADPARPSGCRLGAAGGGQRPAGRAADRVVRTRTDGPALNGALAGTGQLQLAFCVLLSAGILLS